jgi:enolase
MPKIKSISCHKIVNSRGDWTIRTRVDLDDGSFGEQTIPEGASKGKKEAVSVNVNQAVDLVEHPINDLLVGQDSSGQETIDNLMIEMDGTENKSHLGANSILSVSLAVSKASAVSLGLELYEYLAKLYGRKINPDDTFPNPVFNILNGGKHAQNGLSFQEFMIIPATVTDYTRTLDIGTDIYRVLQERLIADGYSTDVGDEGGFAPHGFTTHKALQYLKESAESKYKVGKEVFFGLDVAAESFWDDSIKKYVIAEEKLDLSNAELQEYYKKLINDFELIYMEDPFFEEDLEGWENFCSVFRDKLLVVADDLVVTNTELLKKIEDKNFANAVIVKPNQVGSLTETFNFIRMAKEKDMTLVISHRSGDTAEDTFISDLAVAVGAEFIKSGAPARGERVAKYNRLLEIYHRLGKQHSK